MKSGLILASIALIFVGCASRDTRLEGSWKSNKALTIATMDCLKLRRSKSLTPHQRALLTSLFGKLTVTYHRSTLTYELPSVDGKPPYRYSSRYRIIASNDDSLIFVSKLALNEKPKTTQVYFDGTDRYWVYLGRSGMKEYFDRTAP